MLGLTLCEDFRGKRLNHRVVRLQNMRWKWVSYTSVRMVALASDLIDQDERLHYCVIVHELLHFSFSNHVLMFRELMSAHVPEWRVLENELKKERQR